MAFIQKLVGKVLRPRLKPEQLAKMSPEEVFATIYHNNAWKGTESISGTGSDHAQTAEIAAQLPIILRELKANSILDIPCGDFYWMKDVDLDGIHYTGADIVEDLVEQNQSYASDSRTFTSCDLLADQLPNADVIFCRDCLVHFSNAHVWQALENVTRSRARFLITTTFTQRKNDRSIETGQWRPLNLQFAPFSLPEPLQLIDELCTQDNGEYPDKMLGVWDVNSIRSVFRNLRDAA